MIKNLEKKRHVLVIIGSEIRSMRIKKGVKGETLARALGLTKAAVSQMENGLIDIKVSTLYNIAIFFQTDVSRIVTNIKEDLGQENVTNCATSNFNVADVVLLENLIKKIDCLNLQLEKIYSLPTGNQH